VLFTFVVSPAKTAEPIYMPFGVLTHVGPRNHALDRVKVTRYGSMSDHQGHSRVFAMVPFDRPHTISY